MDDTPTKVEKIYYDMLLSKSPLERLRMTSRMYDSVKKLAISGIKKDKRDLEPSLLRGELFLRIYGNDFSATDRQRIIKKMSNMQLYTDS